MSWWDDATGWLQGQWNQQVQQWNQDTWPWQDPAVQNLFSPQRPSARASTGGGQQPMSAGDFLSRLLQATGGAGGLPGGGGGGGGGPTGYYTPDGVLIQPGSQQDYYYQLADSVWSKYYGSHAPFAIARAMQSAGVENVDQANQVMQGMPSHISNPDGSRIPIGQFESLRDEANKVFLSNYGRPVPDSLVQQLVNEGVTTPNSIDLWSLNHPISDIPKDQYGAIYDQAAGWSQNLHGKSV